MRTPLGLLANFTNTALKFAGLNVDSVTPSPARQRKRRTRLEVYGVTPSRTSTRLRVNDENNEENNVSVDPVMQKYGPPPGMGGGRGRHLTERERVAIYERIVLARCNGDVSPTQVCRLWGMSHNFLQRMDAALAAGTYFVRQSATGCTRQMTDEHLDIVKDINGRTRGKLTWDELAAEFKKETGIDFSPSTIFRNCKRIGWTMRCNRFLPLLTPAHKLSRLKWAHERVDEQWVDWVDVDEKWFFTQYRQGNQKSAPGQTHAREHAARKQALEKVMFTCAVGRPHGTFDGRIGCYSHTYVHTAKRNSKHHKKGDKYRKPIGLKPASTTGVQSEMEATGATVDGKAWKAFVCDKLIPDIRKKMPHSRMVYVQMDSAKAHVDKRVQDAITAVCVARRPHITFVKQPTKSPDTNLLDLCFFRSLSCRIRKIAGQKGNHLSVEELCELVERLFYEAHTHEEIDKMFSIKNAVLEEIIAHDGDNTFKLPHNIELLKALDDLADVARQLDM
jgi:hypothetical protein